jgi:serine/threonine-protein phosphatase 6 regulatory ankyrin repeat subunit B
MTCAILLVCNLSIAQNRQTELNAAARDGDIGRVRQLLDNGVDVNSLDNSKNTALHYAASEGKADVTAILIQK